MGTPMVDSGHVQQRNLDTQCIRTEKQAQYLLVYCT